MAFVRFRPGATSTLAQGALRLSTTTWSAEPPHGSRKIAPLTSESQAYYWSQLWQEGESETAKSLAEGNGLAFSDADAAIRWLLSTDDD